MDSFPYEHTNENSNNPSNFARLHFCGPVFRQNWSLPDTIIFYIIQNPFTSKLYQKIIQTCKYFFSKKPIIVCYKLNYYYDNDAIWVSNESGISKQTHLINSPLWITNEFNIDPDDRIDRQNLTSSIVPKIYRCDAKDLFLWHQHISFKEFVFLASNAIEITTFNTIVKNDDGSVAALEKLIQHTLKASRIELDLDYGNGISVSSETIKNLLALPHFSSLDLFSLEEVPESFDIETFFTYIKKNKHTSFKINFSYNISEGYKIRLEGIIDEILGTENHNYKIPLVNFPEIDNERFWKQRSLYKN